MDLSTLLGNQRIQQTIGSNIGKALLSHQLISTADFTVSVIPSKATLMMGVSFIRLNFLKGSQMIFLGSSEKNSYALIKEFSQLQKFSEDLAAGIKEAVEQEVIAITGAAEFKGTFVGKEELLGVYKKCESSHFLRFQFGTGEKAVELCLPLTANIYQSTFILEQLGFAEMSKILIVDDSKMNRLVLKTYLNALGFNQVDEAHDGKVGLNKIMQSLKKYNLVIADWHMPEMNGIDVLRDVRANLDTKNTPFILATSEQKKEEIIEAVKLKVSGYLIKPYALDTLVKALKNCTKES